MVTGFGIDTLVYTNLFFTVVYIGGIGAHKVFSKYRFKKKLLSPQGLTWELTLSW